MVIYVKSLHSQTCVYIDVLFTIKRRWSGKKIKIWVRSEYCVPKKCSRVPFWAHVQ